MKKIITIEEIKKIANLAHINITEDEAMKYAKQIGEIIDYVTLLDEIELNEVEFKSQNDFNNVFREDFPTESIPQDKILQNRKSQTLNGYIVISSVLEQ